ncbi:uncharacterized protein LOC124834688 [Vigna umbellata]|uniref:uncharacterized protein LOC124834688 n=1 Tax=Vigna umbellata TaxID=87088 RepID=UPI001F5F2225|nr:uncharacterized protein LOC124834688 [Vigna umbellata]
MGQASSSSRPPQQKYQQQSSLSDTTFKLEETLQQFMPMSISYQKSTKSSIRNLEVQIGRLAKKLEDKPENTFGFNIEPNPKEHYKAITTRSGKVLEGVVVRKEDEMEKLNDEKDEEVEEENEKKKEGESHKEKQVAKPLPYPKILSRKEKEGQFYRFMALFKKLEITIPFSEALQQMLSYARFMKDLLTKKRKYIEEDTIEVQRNCSAIIQKLLPPKFKDPESFTIPCTIGKLPIGKTLIDLGASINLMHLSMLKKIGDMEVKPTRMILQLVDMSIKDPYGVIEDVLVKVDKFTFPVEEDTEVPLILGRPFMKTARVIIDVDDGNLKVRLHDETIIFNVVEAIQHPRDR